MYLEDFISQLSELFQTTEGLSCFDFYSKLVYYVEGPTIGRLLQRMCNLARRERYFEDVKGPELRSDR